MDRAVPVIGSVIPGILAFAMLLVSLFNGIGQVQAHMESDQYHSARACAAGSSTSDNCVQVVAVSIEGHLRNAVIVNIPQQGIVLIPIGVQTTLSTEHSVLTPTAMLWHGKVMEVDYDNEQVISAENPDLYVVTWPIVLPFAVAVTVFSVVVYYTLLWATGYGPSLRRFGRARRT